MVKDYGVFLAVGGRLKNADALDWEEYSNSLCEFDSIGNPVRLPGTTFVCVYDGEAILVEKDPTRIVPVNSSVIETDKSVFIGMSYKAGVFGPATRRFLPMDKADFWLAALGLGITEAKVDAEIDKLPKEEAEKARIELRHRKTFERNHPLLSLLSSKLGVTSEQIDGIWPSA